jgi:hypothetical protein
MSRVPLYVTADEIQCVFNRGRYAERFQEGEFFPFVTYVGDSPPGAPRGGFSQTVRYVLAHDHKVTVAVVHQRAGDEYGNPLGDDRPDPKRLIHHGVEYRFSEDAVPTLDLDCPDSR